MERLREMGLGQERAEHLWAQTVGTQVCCLAAPMALSWRAASCVYPSIPTDQQLGGTRLPPTSCLMVSFGRALMANSSVSNQALLTTATQTPPLISSTDRRRCQRPGGQTPAYRARAHANMLAESTSGQQLITHIHLYFGV